MELSRGYKSKNGSKIKHLHGGRIASNPDTVLVIKIPDAQVLRIMSRSLFLTMILAALPFLWSFLRGFSSSSHSIFSGFETASGSINVELLNSILHDLADEGILKKDDKALVVSPPNGFGGATPFKDNEIEVVMDYDLETKSLIPDELYDFVFTSSLEDAKFIDRILKIDGIVALPLGTKPSNAAFREQSNYRVVYLRRYGSVIVALRKTGTAHKSMDSSPRRKLCHLATDTEAKRAALKDLEDVLLEPPRQAFAKSRKYLKKIKYLPDLLGDSLEGYKRRVFIGLGLAEENRDVIQWFWRDYPKKNAKFEIQSLLVGKEECFWLVIYACEGGRVCCDEGRSRGTICLVDELFLECKNEWWQSGKRSKSGRAYWECLALYGRLRDEGVAVHRA